MVSDWNKRPVAQKTPVICSAHFDPEALICSFGKRKLNVGVVPKFRNNNNGPENLETLTDCSVVAGIGDIEAADAVRIE